MSGIWHTVSKHTMLRLSFLSLWQVVLSYLSWPYRLLSLRVHHGTDASWCEKGLVYSPGVDLQQSRKLGFGDVIQPPFDLIHDAFEHHVRLNPLNIAAEHGDQKITYRELDIRANRLAAKLRQCGVIPGGRICLLVHRSIPMVVAILGILKSGACYIPLDGVIITDQSLQSIVEDAEPSMVLTSRAYANRVAAGNVPWLCLEDFLENTEIVSDENSQVAVECLPSHAAYIIFTSGTTGKPKGVIVTHKNVTNLLCLPPGNLGMRPGLRVGQFLNVAFDMCAWEVLGSLVNGCTLCIRGERRQEWIATMKAVDVVISTPTILSEHRPEAYPNIKCVATAGEPCPQALADSWAERAIFYNSCGPTEITIVNTMHLHKAGTPLSIGKPTPNNNVYILDEDLLPVPIGEVGVMWAGGDGISWGYLNRPELTALRYKPDPFLGNGRIMYNTGDLGRWRADGCLEHLGRIDEQVKVKGFRVELDGVSAAMQTCKGVSASVALLHDGVLCGIVIADCYVSEKQVKEATARVQPYYAVPSRCVFVQELPKTSNGKIDKRALLKTLDKAKYDG